MGEAAGGEREGHEDSCYAEQSLHARRASMLSRPIACRLCPPGRSDRWIRLRR